MIKSEQTPAHSYQNVLKEIEPLKEKLLLHPLYMAVSDIYDLQIFMESHAFAVWDFMTLLKTLQQRLTCVSTPWIPPLHPRAARLINEIVMCEESDEVLPGVVLGHYDLYVEAMGEVDANGRPILEFIQNLRNGMSADEALQLAAVPEYTKDFVRQTLQFCKLSDHEVAASFLFGREDVIPEMFQRIINSWEVDGIFGLKTLKLYLNRHIEVDGDTHGPQGALLLQDLCGIDPVKWQQVTIAAKQSIQARLNLWDGLLQEINKEKKFYEVVTSTGLAAASI